MQNIEQNKQNNKILEKLWHHMLRPDYTIPGCMFELTSNQVTILIQSEQPSELNKLLSQEQIQIIKKTLNKSNNKKLYPKINGRTPKDLPLINRQINKPADLIQILHSSEYILEVLHKQQSAEIVLREYIPQMTHNNRVFQIFVRSGYTLAIGQKVCDHIEQEPNEQEYAKIIDIVQEIMPLVTLISPKNHQNSELNSFILTLYLSESKAKITSISVYPPYPQNSIKIFTQTQLQVYHKQIEQYSMHKSEQQKYEANQCVIPLIRTIRKVEDIKHYDMGEYLMGNEIDEQNKLEQWKQFMKEANSQLRE